MEDLAKTVDEAVRAAEAVLAPLREIERQAKAALDSIFADVRAMYDLRRTDR